MRYTARTRSIEWKADVATHEAVAFLARFLTDDNPHDRCACGLQAGMGIVANNVLHDRERFVDDPARPRLLYRARYLDRVSRAGDAVAQWVTVWRAAQLVGVPRGVLQQRVRAGEIELHDGLVSTETLLELYPQAELEQIRHARARRADQGRCLRPARARALAAEPGGAGAAPVSPEPGTGRRATPPAALPRAGHRAARPSARAAGADRRRRTPAARIATPAERRAGAGAGH